MGLLNKKVDELDAQRKEIQMAIRELSVSTASKTTSPNGKGSPSMASGES